MKKTNTTSKSIKTKVKTGPKTPASVKSKKISGKPANGSKNSLKTRPIFHKSGVTISETRNGVKITIEG